MWRLEAMACVGENRRVESCDGDALSRGMRKGDRATGQERFVGATAAREPLAALLDVGDVAVVLKVDRRYVYRLVSERRIPFVKCGHYLRFAPAAR